MNTKKLANEIIDSLINKSNDWEFTQYTVNNKLTGIQIWVANVPIINLSLYRPTRLHFSIIDRWKIYKAVKICLVNQLISINNNESSRI